MRRDSVGFFWDDTPPPKPIRILKEKKTPPEKTWLSADYLPNYEEAKAFNFPIMTDQELYDCVKAGNRFVLDIECYPNYFLLVFTCYETGKIIYEEMDESTFLNIEKLAWIAKNAKLITFNGIKYDMVVFALALNGKTCLELKQASDNIIINQDQPYQILRSAKCKKIEADHIDIIEVAPLKASLKAYGGRLHVKRMQDLPFPPHTYLSKEQKTIVRWYCVNDTFTTAHLFYSLHEDISLRGLLSKEYNVDLRSKSDAQIAEAVISKEIIKINGDRIRAPQIPPGTIYKYKAPAFIKFTTPLMQWALNIIENADYVVNENGKIKLPSEVKALKLRIADNIYRMGIGGLHSSEKSLTLKSTDTHELIDRDVVSYYPFVILNLELFPRHLGRVFLRIFKSIVIRRLDAKAKKQKGPAGTLKIVINGIFGKFGNIFSDVYAPDLLITVTLTGQLSLLMLIEELSLAGIHVVSANTDGIVIHCAKYMKDLCETIIDRWERNTGFKTEETKYRAIFIRDVNNYLALKEDGTFKEKGEFANPWARNDFAEMLKKNPTNTICIEAVEKYLSEGTSISQTIRNCRDIRKFVTVRLVEGGAVKDGEYLGNNIRWYYASGEKGEIVYAKSGNKVARSEGAKPLMLLPESIPNDLDYDWYENEAISFLESFNYA